MPQLIDFKPEDLTNDIIHTLGQQYLDEHQKDDGGTVGNFFATFLHANHSLAKEFAQYNGMGNAYDKWRFLADSFLRLQKDHGELAAAIKNLFVSAFKTSITPYLLIDAADKLLSSEFSHFKDSLGGRAVYSYALNVVLDRHFIAQFKEGVTLSVPASSSLENNPNGVSNALIQQIGKRYLKQIGESTSHSTKAMAVANNLQDFTEENSPHDKWSFLANQYKELDDTDHSVAQHIMSLFTRAFGLGAYSYYITTVGPRSILVTYSLPADEVSLALHGIADHFYVEQYQHQKIFGDRPGSSL